MFINQKVYCLVGGVAACRYIHHHRSDCRMSFRSYESLHPASCIPHQKLLVHYLVLRIAVPCFQTAIFLCDLLGSEGAFIKFYLVEKSYKRLPG